MTAQTWSTTDERRIRWLRENDARLTDVERAELRALRLRETVEAHRLRVELYRGRPGTQDAA